MFSRAVRSPPPSPVKPPERCPYCDSLKIATKGRRLKKLETISLYICRTCDRRFTPGPRALRNKTYPLGEILEALTAYNQGHSLEDAARRLSSRHGHAINPATISRWLSAHPGLTTYRGLCAPAVPAVRLYSTAVARGDGVTPRAAFHASRPCGDDPWREEVNLFAGICKKPHSRTGADGSSCVFLIVAIIIQNVILAKKLDSMN